MLSRNLFAEIATNASKEHSFVSLDESYRSLRELINFSKQLYGDDFRPGRYNANIEVGLQDTLKAYWNTRLRPNFCPGSRAQVCIDVAGQHSQQPGTTTRSNVAEAKAIAWTIKDMLDFAPSLTKPREIRPSDLGVVTPYTGQVLEIRHQVRELDVDLRDILIATTNHAQGKERNIIFSSTVINLGLTRVPMGNPFPIGFVADAKSLNVSLSRGRIGRYIFGGLQAMAQMAVDKHPATYKYKAFFGLVKKLVNEDRAVSAAEWERAMRHRQAPSVPAQSFARIREFKQLLAPVQDHGFTSGARGTHTDNSCSQSLPMPSSVAQPITAHRTGPASALVNQWWDQELKARERLVVAVVVAAVVATVVMGVVLSVVVGVVLGVVVAVVVVVVVVVEVAMVVEVAEEIR
jgi:hypothetical protein